MTNVHFIGIGGSGLSAIARLLLESGYTVSGSDKNLSPLARDLAESGVQVKIGHNPQNVEGAHLVIRSSAIPDDNPEVLAAQAAGIPVYKRADFLGKLMAGRTGIAVAGTHGKTTTTAMIAWMLSSLGQDPSYIIGGVSKNLHANAHAGAGRPFVIEADEYDRMFLGLQPKIIVVTNAEHDHPDCYPTPADYLAAFSEFVGGLEPGGVLIVCRDDPGAFSLIGYVPADCTACTYGAQSSNYQAIDIKTNSRGGFDFQVLWQANKSPAVLLASISLQVPGKHNVQNATAALAVAHQMGLPVDQAALALSGFLGTGRRFDILAEIKGITIVDDYAHHPTEIRATLAAARARYPGRRLWAVWQPHTYSRTQSLLDDFCQSFSDADQVLITEVYAAREKKQDFSAEQLVQKMQSSNVAFVPSLGSAVEQLLEKLRPGDVLLVLSAGDADQISAGVISGLNKREG
ncbi:MAG: UDP-N-acetylmuramate--L-alanine ligase [Anaerolineaceae bacterium]|nr:UDP-N-acetylmuramate--L-alanine ligase [Anaerolineaceae bacterium]